MVGAPFHEGNGGELANEGRAYVVFGKPLGQSFSTTVTAAQIEGGTGGFSIIGVDSNDTAGKAVSSAGDVNGDGINDILIGAPNADPVNGVSTGAAYVVFGKPAGQSFGTGVDLSGLNGTNGFRINADLSASQTGSAVSAAGDLNGDGFGDLIVADRFHGNSGATFVVFGGSAVGSTGVVELSAINGVNGFRACDLDNNASVGESVSSTGDVNGDGVADFLVGARTANVNPDDAGKAFLVFGGTNVGDNQLAILPLSQLDGQIGVQIDGVGTSDQSGRAVRLLGDVNGDGFGDALIGAPYADYGTNDTGSAYLVLGSSYCQKLCMG